MAPSNPAMKLTVAFGARRLSARRTINPYEHMALLR
jgi:hypothetical protein